MKTSPSLTWEPHPSHTPNQVTHPRVDSGVNAPSSNTTVADTTSNGEGGGRWAATVLLLTHVVEVATMVTVIFAFAFPTDEKGVSGKQNEIQGKASTKDDSTNSSMWNKPILPLQIALTTAPLVLITTISLVWAVKAQDFSERITARMLCWLLHILHASILWRFLKVHLAFNSSDVAELGTLRFVQVHLHTLPFLVMHMAIILGAPVAPSVLSVLAATVLVVSAVVAVVVATTASRSPRPSSLTPPTITQIAHIPIHGSQQASEHTRNHDYAARVVVAVTTACTIWSRAVAVAALFCLTITWTSVLIGMHWIIALIWLSLQDELDPETLGPARKILRRIFLAYLLLWDWHVFRDDASAMTVCARPRLPAAYYSITAIQNMAVTATWYTASKVALSVVRTAILSSVLAAQAVALLLLVLSYLYCSSLLPSWPQNKACSIARTASLVTPTAKSVSYTTPSDNHDNSSYIDFKDAEEGLVPDHGKEKMDVEECEDPIVTPLRILSRMAHSTPRNPMPPAPHLMAAHLPPTMFSYSHDILPPHLTKLERSLTDNESFNSRNTNTFQNQLFQDYDDPRNQRTPTPASKSSFASRSSCKKSYCDCKLFDGIEGPCDVEEEDDKVNDDNRIERPESHNEKHKGSTISSRINKSRNLTLEKGIGTTNNDAIHDSVKDDKPMCMSAPQVADVKGIQRFRVVCAACLHAHDPLLTQCHSHTQLSESPVSTRCPTAPPIRGHIALASSSQSCGGLGGESRTDYPSDTELTATADILSTASADSHSTYTTWPVGRGPGMARLLQLHPGSHDYVTAWLKHQQSRGPWVPPPPSNQLQNETFSSTLHDRLARHHRHIPHPIRHKVPPPPHLLQDLETVV